MRLKQFTLPLIIFIVDLMLIFAAHSYKNILYEPAVPQAEFPFSVTYKLNGKTHTIESTYTVSYIGYVSPSDPTTRCYEGIYADGNPEDGHAHVIAQNETMQLLLYTPFTPGYLMNDPQYTTNADEPYLAVRNERGSIYTDETSLARFDATVLEWDYAQPIENTFFFSGIGHPTIKSVFLMLYAAYIGLLVCVFCVTIDEPYFFHSDTDRLSTGFNYFLSLLIIPSIAILTKLIGMRVANNELIYQLHYCIPAFSVLCVSASVCLRRKGFPVSALVVQFFGPAAFIVASIVEANL